MSPALRKFILAGTALWIAVGVLFTAGYMWAWGFIVPRWIPDSGYWCSEPYSPVTLCDTAVYNGKILVGMIPLVFVPVYILFRMTRH